MSDIHTSPIMSHSFWRYCLAAALVATALTLSLTLEVPFGNPFWFFFPVAVIGSTWYGGRRPGWLTVALSTAAVMYFFVPPLRSFRVNPHDVPLFFTFVACQIAANWLISWRRRVEDSLREAHNQLEIRVGERTNELKQAYESLRKQIEEQKRTEQALQLTRTELARVARITTIGELTASIAHEVNQPLAAVVANADACIAWLALQSPHLEEARAAAERTVQGATRASDVIRRIRSMIKKAAPEKAPVQLNEIIAEVIALTEDSALRNTISVSVELMPDLPVIVGDRIQLQQVILNLMINGIEAMTNASHQMHKLIVRSGIQDQERICVSIEDNGIGVKSEMMGRLFEPFFTTRSEGIGMGLPISLSIIEAHGGRLWAESAMGRGSVFQFVLPVGDGESI
jgi:C4-dicarboxylate-specific signal transduction histidine kinase